MRNAEPGGYLGDRWQPQIVPVDEIFRLPSELRGAGVDVDPPFATGRGEHLKCLPDAGESTSVIRLDQQRVIGEFVVQLDVAHPYDRTAHISNERANDRKRRV